MRTAIMDAARAAGSRFNIPEGLMAMRGGRGWQGNWGPFHFDFGDDGLGRARGGRGRRGARACSKAASFGSSC